jgi:hypothetical protein
MAYVRPEMASVDPLPWWSVGGAAGCGVSAGLLAWAVAPSLTSLPLVPWGLAGQAVLLVALSSAAIVLAAALADRRLPSVARPIRWAIGMGVAGVLPLFTLNELGHVLLTAVYTLVPLALMEFAWFGVTSAVLGLGMGKLTSLRRGGLPACAAFGFVWRFLSVVGLLVVDEVVGVPYQAANEGWRILWLGLWFVGPLLGVLLAMAPRPRRLRAAGGGRS